MNVYEGCYGGQIDVIVTYLLLRFQFIFALIKLYDVFKMAYLLSSTWATNLLWMNLNP